MNIDKLNMDIMNIPCDASHLQRVDERMAYKLGHRDARHAAVECVLEHSKASGSAATSSIERFSIYEDHRRANMLGQAERDAKDVALAQAKDAICALQNKRGYGCGEGSDWQVEQHNKRADEQAADAIKAIAAMSKSKAQEAE